MEWCLRVDEASLLPHPVIHHAIASTQSLIRNTDALVRHQDFVDDLDHAVGLVDVISRDTRGATLLVPNDDVHRAVHRKGERSAIERFQHERSVALPNPCLESLRVVEAAYHVVGQDLGQSVLVFGLDKGIDSTIRQQLKRGVCRSLPSWSSG